MALSTAKFYDLPFHHRHRSALRLLFSPAFLLPRRRATTGCAAASRPATRDARDSGSRSAPSTPWLQKWSPVELVPDSAPVESERGGRAAAGSSIERIVHRLRNLGLTDEDGEEDGANSAEVSQRRLNGDERLSDLLQRKWSRPDQPVGSDSAEALLPWERDGAFGVPLDADNEKEKKRRVKAPTLAELTIEDEELRRLRRLGMGLRERMTVPKAGVTQAIAQKIHDAWRRSELVRLKFHESLAADMKTAHELVERRTGGLVIWRSGSVMVVYRGSNYQRPSEAQDAGHNPPAMLHVVPDASAPAKSVQNRKETTAATPEKRSSSQLSLLSNDEMTEEELEYNQLLDELGPRFVDWWSTGVLPVDADLLPQTVPGFKTPLRLLPTGMRSQLTNAEMTNLRKLAKGLPSHFALGRNRHHQGLAVAILKLWEKSLLVKIAVKRGIQNTNNKLMADELKMLTGGVLLLRNKYYIVMYRGKDFLPTSVATALAERHELTEDIYNSEEKTRRSFAEEPVVDNSDGHALAGTLAEFQQSQARWGRDISLEEREQLKLQVVRSEKERLFNRIEHKLSLAQAKKARAEKLLSKIEAAMIPVDPTDDQEILTDEERSVFRRIGLQMKSYLPLGIRGVFDGVIENMHLHWKHRELVKLISKQKILQFVEDTAKLLEYESGGILVAIERVPKGFALIYYRGKNYQRPINLRPRNLLTKAKALKRAVAIQRHEALSQHIEDLEGSITKLRLELGMDCAEGDASYPNPQEPSRTTGDDFDNDGFLDSVEEQEEEEEEYDDE